jgi:hypothetical protein
MRLLVARCEVTYTGRLSTVLPGATRLLMFKDDGSFLVHDDAGGYKPLNRIRSAFRPDFPAYLRLDVKVSGALARRATYADAKGAFLFLVPQVVPVERRRWSSAVDRFHGEGTE